MDTFKKKKEEILKEFGRLEGENWQPPEKLQPIDKFVWLEDELDSLLLSLKEEVENKDEAYHERNMLVQALTKLFPAYLARHDENDIDWEKDWMWIVYIELPTGQVSWHIHDDERNLFDHLAVKENNWDGHNTERKYQRLQSLATLSNEDKHE